MGLFMFEYWLILWRWSSFSNIFLWRARAICWDHSKTSSVQAREVFQWFNSSAVFTMHVATIRLVLCLFICSDLLPANSQKPQIDSIDQSELVRKARDIRQHRQIRQTLFILTEDSSLISYIFVDIVIWNFFLNGLSQNKRKPVPNSEFLWLILNCQWDPAGTAQRESLGGL